MKHLYILLVTILLGGFTGSTALGQSDSNVVNQDAIYNRPFISLGQTRTAVGGYLEGNTNYFSEDGITEGFSMEMRRFNIFLYAPIGNRIRFLSELEFEHGTQEIGLETALMDFEVNPALNFRAGILLPAIGIFNTNHDSPNWEIANRPISSTAIIPTTLSEVGFGLHGQLFPDEKNILTYDLYVVNGLQDGIILNPEGRTNLASGKDPAFFGEDNNGEPMLNGRFSYAHRKYGEVGLAYYGGTYNTYRLDGEQVDSKRNLSVVAMDFSTSIKKLTVQGEAVASFVDVPDPIQEIYGERQWGGFVDLVYPVMQRKLLRFEKAVVNLSVRGEYADLNGGAFTTNISESAGEINRGLAVGVSLRPRAGTVIRANYRYHWVTDVLNNPVIRIAGFQFGVASYF